jgi:hypothetical protein
MLNYNFVKLNFLLGGILKKHFVVTLVAALLLVTVVSKADVVVKTKTSADMAGMMTMQTDGVNDIKGDKSYNSLTTQMTGGMASMLGMNKPKDIVNITRLDKNVYWELDTEKKNYKETTMEQLKKRLDESREEGEKGDQPEYTWTVEVKPIEGSQTINGFKCNGMLGKATGVNKKEAADTIFISYEQWAAKEVPGSAEVEAYGKKYAAAMGIDEMWAKENMGSMLKQYGSEFAELAIKVNDKGGYPIKTIVTVEGAAKPEGESSENSAAAAMDKMNKMLGKKTTDEDTDKGGRMKALSFTNEVLSIEQKAIGDNQFEIPEGYQKK